MRSTKTLEVLEKTYWLFIDFLLYAILYLFFILTVLGVFIKTMIDKIFYSLFGAMDNLWNFFTAPRCKCKKIKKGEKHDKLKTKAMHYWSDHKIECFVVAILVVAYIVK